MMKLLTITLNFISVWLRLMRPGGIRAIAAENIALRKQLIVLSRRHKRAPKLTTFDLIIFGVLTAMINVKRLSRIAIGIKPANLLTFHKALVQRKYKWIFSTKTKRKPGPKGPSKQSFLLL